MVKTAFRLLCIALLMLTSGAGAGALPRTLHFEQLSATPLRAMPSATSALAQDKQGFIWAGSQNGVYRHDGQRTVHFLHDDTDPHSLPGDYVGALFSDRAGRVWLGTNKGLARHEPATNRFVHYGQENVFVNAIASDGKDGLWLGTKDGLQHVDPQGRFASYPHDPARADSLAAGSVNALAVDAHGGLWLGGPDSGLDYLAPGAHGFVHYALPDGVTALQLDRSGELWIGTSRGVLRWHPGQPWQTRRALDAPDGLAAFWVFSMYEDRHGRLWVSTLGSGLFEWDGGAQRFLRYRYSPGDHHGLPSDHVRAAMVDRSDTLWVGTWGAGVARADLGSAGLGRFLPGVQAQSADQDSVVACLSRAGAGQLWLGGPGGLHLYDSASGSLLRSERHVAGQPGSLPSSFIMAVLQQDGGPLWVGTPEGLSRRDRPDGPFVQVPIASGGVARIAPGRNGRLWLSTDRGVLHFDPASGEATRIDYDAGVAGRPTQGGVNVLMEDSRGRVWIGNPQGRGLDLFDPATGRQSHYRHQPQADSLGNDFVRSLYQDGQGRVWIGTLKGLTQVVDGADGSVQFRRVAPALDAVYVEAIQSDQAGQLWIGGATARGEVALIKVDPASGASTFFYPSDGINDGDFYDGAALHDEQGNLFFGTLQGLTTVQPAIVRSNQLVPELAIVDITVANRSLRQSPLAPGVSVEGGVVAPRSLSLPWDAANVQVDFAALHYADPDRNRYAWRLDGVDTGWIAADAAHSSATYTHLAPGSYRLRMKAASKNGVWNDSALALAITVRPPFWASWWFRALALGCTLAGLMLAYRWRMLRLRWRERQLKDLVDLRTAELQRAMLEQQAIFDSALTGIAFSRNQLVQRCNVAFERILGYAHGELTGQSLRCLFFSDSGFERRQQRMERMLALGRSVAVERRYRRKDGSAVWCSAIVKALDEHNLQAGMVLVLQDITARKDAEKALRLANQTLTELSMLDGLTGIANRRRFDAVVAVEWQRAVRQQSPFGLALIDIDHFKAYNDQFGHPAGDQCLRSVAQQLAQGLRRGGDFVARYGGEEFVVVLPGQTEQEVAEVLERLRLAVEALALPHARAAGAPWVTVSIGFVAHRPQPGDSLAGMLEQVDQNLYQAKRLGRNRIVGAA